MNTHISLLQDKIFVKEYIQEHHYSHKIPQAIKYRFGLYLEKDLVGVAIYSVPANQYAITSVYSKVHQTIGLELSRVWTEDWVPKNFSSNILAKTFRYLRATSPYDVVISYADPNFGHQGISYQALNGLYLGVTSKEIRYILPNGSLVTRRGLGRKNGDSEKEHAHRLISIGAKKIKMEGKHKYLFYICDKRRKKILECKRIKPIIKYPTQILKTPKGN